MNLHNISNEHIINSVQTLLDSKLFIESQKNCKWLNSLYNKNKRNIGNSFKISFYFEGANPNNLFENLNSPTQR